MKTFETLSENYQTKLKDSKAEIIEAYLKMENPSISLNEFMNDIIKNLHLYDEGEDDFEMAIEDCISSAAKEFDQEEFTSKEARQYIEDDHEERKRNYFNPKAVR